MKKYFTFIFLYMFIRNSEKTLRVYKGLYGNESQSNSNVSGSVSKNTNVSRRPDDLDETLKYLKSKKIKTKKDRESISIIETILSQR